MDLLNGKEILVGLRNLSIKIHNHADEHVFHSTPNDRSTGRIAAGTMRFDPLPVVNLQPRQWVHLELTGFENDPQEVRHLVWWSKVEFVSERQRRGLFEPKTLRKTIATRPPYGDSFVRRSS